MILHPCHECRHNSSRLDRLLTKNPPCWIKESVLAKIRGAGLTVARFTCDMHRDEFQPGNRVKATIRNATVGREDGYGIPQQGVAVIPGTVMRWVGRKVLVWLDESEEAETARKAVKVKPCNLEPTGETVGVCQECGRPNTAASEGDWQCSVCGKPYIPEEL